MGVGKEGFDVRLDGQGDVTDDLREWRQDLAATVSVSKPVDDVQLRITIDPGVANLLGNPVR